MGLSIDPSSPAPRYTTSVQSVFVALAWECEECHAMGIINIPEDMPEVERLERIRAKHSEIKPDCRALDGS